MTITAPRRIHLHPLPKHAGYCPMCGRRLRLGSYCGYEGYHTNPRRCLSCRKAIHAPSAYAGQRTPAIPHPLPPLVH